MRFWSGSEEEGWGKAERGRVMELVLASTMAETEKRRRMYEKQRGGGAAMEEAWIGFFLGSINGGRKN